MFLQVVNRCEQIHVIILHDTMCIGVIWIKEPSDVHCHRSRCDTKLKLIIISQNARPCEE